MKEEKISLREFRTIEQLKNGIRDRFAKHSACGCILDDFRFDGSSFVIRWRAK